MESTDLAGLAREQLASARRASSARAARTIHGGRDHLLRQTVVALLAGHELAKHENPGEATLQVLRGHARLTTASETWEGAAGDHVVIPPTRHALKALDDVVVLLSVVSRREP